MPTFDFLCKKLKCCRFIATNARKDGIFPKYNCFFTVDFLWFEEIVSGTGV